MTFTDDDLKRLKEDCEKDFTGIFEYQQKAILSLIARLEAAENVLDGLFMEAKNTPPDLYRVRDRLLAWREAAGK